MVRDKRATGGVGWLVKKNIRSKLLLRIEGAVWVELQVAVGNNMIVGVVYVKGGLHHFSPKLSVFFFVAVITFFPFLLCK